MFTKYGKVKNVEMKRDFAFIEYDDSHQADDAIKDMDGKRVDGHKLIVQMAVSGKKRDRGPGRDDVCFNCGKKGHW